MDDKKLEQIVVHITDSIVEKADSYFKDLEEKEIRRISELEENLVNISKNLESVVSVNTNRVEELQRDYLEVLAEITIAKTQIESLQRELLLSLKNMKNELVAMINKNDKNIRRLAVESFGTPAGGKPSLRESVVRVRRQIEKQQKVNKILIKKTKYIERKLTERKNTSLLFKEHIERISEPFVAITKIIYKSILVRIAIGVAAAFGFNEIIELKDILKFILGGL